jgi:hypothetical protein
MEEDSLNEYTDISKLIYYTNSSDYFAFKVELCASKLATIRSGYQNVDSQLSPNDGGPETTDIYIMLKLRFPIISYYEQLETFNDKRSFISEHDINLEIVHIENNVAELLGYMPQDLEKRSILKLIHPSDWFKFKKAHIEIYNNRLKNGENNDIDSSISGEICKWRCFNGCFVNIKSNWSCFVHPWKNQIDFIIGKHMILDEPINKNIFDQPYMKQDSNDNKDAQKIIEDESSQLAYRKLQKEISDHISKVIKKKLLFYFELIAL